MERPLRQRLVDMLLIKTLVRSGALTREQASLAVQEGREKGCGMPRVLIAHGWVSHPCLHAAMRELRATMRDLDQGASERSCVEV